MIPAGLKFVDSVKTDKRGNFTVKLEQGKILSPEFYNLRIKGGGVVSLLLESGEKVKVQVADSTARTYTLEGSQGSLKVQEANRLLGMGASKLDSLERVFDRTEDAAELERIAGEYVALETARKQAVISFLVGNAGSMATIVPLYKPMRDGNFVLGETEEVIYYRMVADSLSARYPEAPYTRSLLTDVKRMENVVGGSSLIESNLDNEVTFPDINLPDVLGKRRRLSDLKGKVILLSFTASNVPEFKVLNRELVEVYEKYKEQGLEIYQVSLDANKAQWINSVAEQRLPWISVCDFQGADSPAVTLYGVQTVPTNFLIDREGHIVNRGVKQSEIETAIKPLL